MTDCSKALESNKPILYNAAEMNDLFSVLLSTLTEDGMMTMDEGLKLKSIFNTFLDMIVNDQQTCDNILAETREIAREMEEKENENEWNILDAAENIKNEVITNKDK